MDNCYRDASFAFGNQLAQLSDAIGLDAHEIVNSANFGYPRTNLAFPGLVGGPCLSKDPIILSESVVSYGAQSSLSDVAREVNLNTTFHVAGAIARIANARGHKSMLVTGLAFKGRPATDDLRGSPSLELLQILQDLCPEVEIKCHDFEVGSDVIENKGLISGKLNRNERFDILVIANNHPSYSSLENSLFEQILPADGLLYDLWGITKDSWPKQGPSFTVMGLGWRL
jgi:UDP-N-acetyl-D-mannosaminuronic acid dehydrogenase